MTIAIRENISLAQYTTLKTGGFADYVAEVTSVEELQASLEFARQNAAPLYILGGGSNVLFPDEGFVGLVIRIKLQGIAYSETGDQVLLTCAAGEVWDEVVADSASKGYWGLENLSSIPGTVGATPVQNVGAYGVEVSQLIQSVVCVSSVTGQEKIFSNDECLFGYRDSFFKSAAGKEWVVVSVQFLLTKTFAPVLTYKDVTHLETVTDLTSEQVRTEVMLIRAGKFPDWSVVGTAGSFFKNPVVDDATYTRLQTIHPAIPAYSAGVGQWKISLGWLLDKGLNLKGCCEHEVCLYEKQALVLVTTGNSSTAVQNFYQTIQKKVAEKYGIHIEPEVQIISNT